MQSSRDGAEMVMHIVYDIMLLYTKTATPVDVEKELFLLISSAFSFPWNIYMLIHFL